MNKQLPERPDFGQLKKLAKELLADVHAGEPAAVARVAEEKIAREDFALHDAQRVLAREFGFASWAKLKLHVETREIDAAEARLVEAALEGEREAVGAILAERPQLATRAAWTAAALGREAAHEWKELAKDRGGPRDWPLLLYVCFGRCGGGDAERARMARALLENGADPNAYWIHGDWPESPLPALYGATGVNDYPQLARVLLEAGANPNDGESRYHAAEHHHVASLEVLAEFGCDFSRADGQWSTTPLVFLLGWTDPSRAVRDGLRWLLDHGADPNVRSLASTVNQTALHAATTHGWDADMIRCLLEHGADAGLTRADGRTAYALAVRSGQTELAELLREHGSTTAVAPRDWFLGACMEANEARARDVLKAHPELMETLSPEDRKMPILAAKRGRAGALAALAHLGFDVAIAGDWSEHPLHWAAWHGWADAVRALIGEGVELSVCDRRFGAAPSGWCAHGSEHCANPKGEYARAMEMLIDAGAFVAPDTEGSAEVMAVLRRRGIGRGEGKSRGG
jgi:ankyrin repeat protein